jgi:hypothetical protein
MRVSRIGDGLSAIIGVRLQTNLTRLVLIAAVLLFVGSTASIGQSYYGSLRGVVRDPGGSVVPGATMTLMDQSTNAIRTTVTQADGGYVFNSVIPSTYSVTLEAKGFEKVVHSDVTVSVQQQVSLDLTVKVGTVTQTVEVKGGASVIETENASTGQNLSGSTLSVLPNIGRNPFIMTKMSANVIMFGNPVMNRMEDQSTTAQTSVAGGMGNQGNYLLDGISISDWDNRPIIIPTIEAVQDEKIQINTYDAEMGRTGGGVYNTYLKSGSNQFHGSAYGAIRRTQWDANLFFNNRSGLPLGAIPNDNWAGFLGGPVFIPKIYDGRNKTFWFFSLEGYNDGSAASWTTFVPTAAEKAGDFSHTVTASGAPLVIYDPLTTVQNADGTYRRTPFPGNIIPANRINAVGSNIASYYPLPTSTPSYYGDEDVTSSVSLSDRAREYVFKLDEQLFGWWHASFSYLHCYTSEPGDNYFGGPAAPEQWTLQRKEDVVAANSLLTLSPTMVLAIRYGQNRFPNHFFTTSEVAGFNPATLGFPDSYVSQLQGFAFPNITASTMFAGDTLSNNNHSLVNLYSRNFSTMLSKSMGRHNLRMGFDFRLIAASGSNYADQAGNFTFNGVFTQSTPTTSVAGTGADLADMLLGYPETGDTELVDVLTDYTHYYATFFQDDFHISKNLTLNLGLRWERELGFAEDQNRNYVNFNQTEINPISSLASYTTYGVFQFAGQGLNPTTVGSPNLNKLGPRLGAAYQLNEKTVIRGGYGLIWAPQSTLLSPYAPSAFSSTTPYVASNNGFATPANSLSNPFPSGLLKPGGTAQGGLTGIGENGEVWSPTAKSPYIQQYSVDIQRELPSKIAFSIGYVGSRGTHLAWDQNQNVLNLAYFSQGTALNKSVPNPFYGKGGVGVVGNATVPTYQLLLPYSAFGTVTFSSTDLNKSRYDSLVVKGEKQITHGASFLATLTWSKSMDSASTGNTLMSAPSGVQNPFDLQAERSLSQFSAPLTFQTGIVYELPVGRGRDFLNNSNLVVDSLLGGWQLNAVAIYRTGFPIAITQNQNFNSAFGYPGQRPNFTGVSPKVGGSLNSKLNQFINPAAFSEAPEFTFGNVSRFLSMRGPDEDQWDMSLFKTANIYKEILKAQFRFEAFNVFNTPEFNGPNNAFGTSNFGQITSQANTARQLQIAVRFMW